MDKAEIETSPNDGELYDGLMNTGIVIGREAFKAVI